MSNDIKTQLREVSSKGAVNALRQQGMIPAVMYGAGKGPQPIAVDGHDILMTLQKGHFFTHRHMLDVDGKKQEVLARDVHRHPVSDKILHIDFLRYDPKRITKVMVAVRVIDEDKSPGLKIGGVLQLVRPEVELVCRADSIPEEVVISMAGKEIGDSAHISEVTLPEGVKPSVDRDFTIASVVSTRTSKSSDADEEATETEAEEGAEASAEGAEGAEASE